MLLSMKCTAITHKTFSSEEYTKHPFEVMIYAMRHGYGKLMDKAERKVLEVSLTMAFECFTPQVYIAWVSHKINRGSSARTPLNDAVQCCRRDIMNSG